MKAYGTHQKPLNTKIESNLAGSLKSNVVRVSQQEPYDKKILAKLGNKCNIFHRLIILMKLDTQTYYNIQNTVKSGYLLMQ